MPYDEAEEEVEAQQHDSAAGLRSRLWRLFSGPSLIVLANDCSPSGLGSSHSADRQQRFRGPYSARVAPATVHLRQQHVQRDIFAGVFFRAQPVFLRVVRRLKVMHYASRSGCDKVDGHYELSPHTTAPSSLSRTFDTSKPAALI